MSKAGEDLGDEPTPPQGSGRRRARGSFGRTQVIVRSALFHVLFYVHLVAVLVLLTPVYFFLPQRGCLSVIRGLANRSLWLLRIVCGTGVEFRGLAHLPQRPFILAHKHQSMWEILALTTIVRSPTWIIKSELLLVPLVGWWAKKAGNVFVKRGSRSAALAQLTAGCSRALDRGRTIVLAPEGTRRLPGAPPAYKYGIAHLRKTFDVPIVPAALNSGLYWPWWGFLRYPGTIVVSFLPAIEASVSDESFITSLQEQIEGECDRLILEAFAEPGTLRRLAKPPPAPPSG